MGETTGISWTDHTFNPWWGCAKVSEGCKHCYAEAFDKRVGGAHWGPGQPRRTFGDAHWTEPLKWDRTAERRGQAALVFCASMADVFDDEGPSQERQRLWGLIAQTNWLDWLLLTKRPANARKYLPWTQRTAPLQPWRNVWIGTSVEDRKSGVPRISILREVQATKRFLSCEPLLEDLGTLDLEGIHWVILGGESGPHRRPLRIEWLESIVEQCRAQGVAVFVKQDAGQRPGQRGRIPDSLWLKEFPRDHQEP